MENKWKDAKDYLSKLNMPYKDKFYLIKVTAFGCPACDIYSNYWETHQNIIQKYGGVAILNLVLPSTRDDPDEINWPVGLGKWIDEYPTLLLFTAESWDDRMINGGGEHIPNDGSEKSVVFNLRGSILNSTTLNMPLFEIKNTMFEKWLKFEMQRLSSRITIRDNGDILDLLNQKHLLSLNTKELPKLYGETGTKNNSEDKIKKIESGNDTLVFRKKK